MNIKKKIIKTLYLENRVLIPDIFFEFMSCISVLRGSLKDVPEFISEQGGFPNDVMFDLF